MTLVQLHPRYPAAPLFALDTLWFQVAGTICNLRCTHCFISCAPENHSHQMMSFMQVKRFLDEAAELGVKEYYFTGGEPFMNRELYEMLEAALVQGPVSVLTNGVLIKEDTARRLKELSDGSEYSFDLRISIDGWDRESNDPIRGEGTFERILEGIDQLARAGINPVITVTEACGEAAGSEGRLRFLSFLREIGLHQPRLKVLPLIRLGAEESRVRGYQDWETLAGVALTEDEADALQCSRGRMVCERGVYVCPILIDSPDAMMGATLKETLRPFSLSHRACYTCHVEGLRCAT
jgi:MoaA/NifB/PqqE/SkfB family radical SAM enzyme